MEAFPDSILFLALLLYVSIQGSDNLLADDERGSSFSDHFATFSGMLLDSPKQNGVVSITKRYGIFECNEWLYIFRTRKNTHMK